MAVTVSGHSSINRESAAGRPACTVPNTIAAPDGTDSEVITVATHVVIDVVLYVVAGIVDVEVNAVSFVDAHAV